MFQFGGRLAFVLKGYAHQSSPVAAGLWTKVEKAANHTIFSYKL